jgi:hypothetical protein
MSLDAHRHKISAGAAIIVILGRIDLRWCLSGSYVMVMFYINTITLQPETL